MDQKAGKKLKGKSIFTTEVLEDEEAEKSNVENDVNTLSLERLLEPDTSEIKSLKTLHKKEEEYSPYLLAFEYPIAYYYLEYDRKLTDKDVVRVLRNIKKGIGVNLSCFDDPLGATILEALAEALAEKPISKHELVLVIDYILWCIDNRSWMGDKQSYVKGLCYMFNLYSELEERQYVQHIEKLGKKLGFDKNTIDGLLLKNEEPVDNTDEESRALLLESEFFAMDDKSKVSFLLGHGYEHFDLFEKYVVELGERKEFGVIKELVNHYIKECDDKTELYVLAGTILFEEDKNRAKSYYCKALHELEQDNNVPERTKMVITKELKKLIKKCDKSN